jgi:hypothetical protein
VTLSTKDFIADLLGGYTEAELSAAFALVAPKENWKLPIEAVIPKPSPYDAALLKFAVAFYTGGKAKFTGLPSGKAVLVTSPGYYAAVGA